MCIKILIITTFGSIVASLAVYFLVFFDCDGLERIGFSLKSGLVAAGIVLIAFLPIFLFYILGLL